MIHTLELNFLMVMGLFTIELQKKKEKKKKKKKERKKEKKSFRDEF